MQVARVTKLDRIPTPSPLPFDRKFKREKSLSRETGLLLKETVGTDLVLISTSSKSQVEENTTLL